MHDIGTIKERNAMKFYAKTRFNGSYEAKSSIGEVICVSSDAFKAEACVNALNSFVSAEARQSRSVAGITDT